MGIWFMLLVDGEAGWEGALLFAALSNKMFLAVGPHKTVPVWIVSIRALLP